MNEPHDHPHPHPAPPVATEDAGQQALAEALHSSFSIIKFVMVLLVGLFLCSGVFTVGSQEKAIILRFGKPTDRGDAALLGPGFHWAWPYPIDEVVKVSSGQIQIARSSIGWFAVGPGEDEDKAEPNTESLNPSIDGYTLTGDGNIMHVRATVRYRITDPIKYYFNFTNAAEVVTNLVNNAVLQVSSRALVDDAVRRDRSGFTERVLARVDELTAREDLGITREQSEVVAIPPRQLKQSFAAVGNAEQDRSKTNNAARSYEAEVLSRAKGEATARINAGETDRTRQVAFVAAEAKYFSDLLPLYQENPQLFIRRVQGETLHRVLTNVHDKIFLPDRADGKARELRIMLNREPEKLPQ